MSENVAGTLGGGGFGGGGGLWGGGFRAAVEVAGCKDPTDPCYRQKRIHAR